MPNKRADGVTSRGIPLHVDLWTAAGKQATADGVALTEAVRRLLAAYAAGRIDLPPE